MHPPVTYIYAHGVGMWPGLFTETQQLIGGRSVCWVRPGYGDQPIVDDFQGQVDVLQELVENNAPAIVIGVSGGATLALALAMRMPDGLAALIAHEPLIGGLEPLLHARITSAAAQLSTDCSVTAVEGFLAGLYDAEVWATLPDQAKSWAVDHASTIAREVAHFASFHPSRATLDLVSIPHLTVVGQRSGPERQRVARMLRFGGAERKVMPNAGHMIHVEQPNPLAEAITDFVNRTVFR